MTPTYGGTERGREEHGPKGRGTEEPGREESAPKEYGPEGCGPEGYGLKGRAAVVTGATRGIGRAVAGRLAAAGALVCVSARDADEVRRTAGELGGVGL